MHWYALTVRGRSEATVESWLERDGYETFHAATEELRRDPYTYKRTPVRVPLFPGYLFARFHAVDKTRILDVPNVLQIVSIAGRPLPVAEGEIETFQTLIAANYRFMPRLDFHPGQRVRVPIGNAYAVGTLERIESGAVLIVSLTLLGKSFSVPVDASLAEAA